MFFKTFFLQNYTTIQHRNFYPIIHLFLQEKHLLKAIESKDDKQSEEANKRLKEVYAEMEAIGADKAESRARRILSVSID